MSQYPLTRRDTRVRFSVDHVNSPVGDNLPDDMDHRQPFPITRPEFAHITRTHEPPLTHSRRASWAPPGLLSPPQGYIRNPHFDEAQWGGHPQGDHSALSASLVSSRTKPYREDAEISPLDPLPVPPDPMLANTYSLSPSQGHPTAHRPHVGQDVSNGRALHSFDSEWEPRVRNEFLGESSIPAPQNVLRSAMRRSYSEDFSAPGVTRANSGSNLEAGGVRRKQEGVFSNLIHSYGFSRRERHVSEGTVSTGVDSRYQSQAVSRANSNESAGALLRLRRTRRRDSVLSLGGDALLDDDDPRITGVKPNRLDDEKKARETFKSSLKLDKIGDPTIVLNINSEWPSADRICVTYAFLAISDRQKFILRLAKALMTYGAPSHRIESQLIAAARVLEVDASFVHLPSIIIASFGDPASNQSETHFVKSGGGLDLGRLHETHTIYRKVVHDEIGAKDGTLELVKLMRRKPIYGLRIRCILALLCSAIICPIGFSGSFADMWVAGLAGMALCWLQLYAASKSALYSSVFE